jgi:hypothetical protein
LLDNIFPEYDDFKVVADNIYYLLLVSVFFAYLYLVYNVNSLMLSGYKHIARNISISVSCVSCIIAFISINYLGAIGAAVTILLSRMCLAFISMYYSKSRVGVL